MKKMLGKVGENPLGIVLLPTRELVSQMEKLLLRISKYLPQFRVAAMTGGIPLWTDRTSLKNPLDLVIGRLGLQTLF